MTHARWFLLLVSSALCLVVLVAPSGSRADEPATSYRWPTWRGADGQGLADRASIPSEEGDTYVVKAGLGFEIVGQNPLDEPVGASAAVAGGRLYIRGEKHLFAIGNTPAS